MYILYAGPHRISLAEPVLMGVVNVTPDSFSDGGRLAGSRAAVDHALRLHDAGAAILDVGGESTRPGATPVPVEEELQRVLPVVEALAQRGHVVSIDSRKPDVMRAALAAGAAMVNDVAALQAPGALEVVGASNAAVCLMHMQGAPQTMQQAPCYADVVEEVKTFLAARVAAAEQAGIGRERLVIDPGFGFGKALEHNLELLGKLDSLLDLGLPILAGMSRKAMLGALTGRPVGAREFAGVAAHLIAVARGARILRVHNVAAMHDALAIWKAVEGRNHQDGS